VRTLHLYDEQGLLKPAYRTAADYRMYGREELLRLQQILFFRELGLPLKEIRKVLDAPDFRLKKALEAHRSALEKQKNRIETLIRTLENTMETLDGGEIMENPEELYRGLSREEIRTYRKEARERYGTETVERSEKHLMKKTDAELMELQQRAAGVYRELYELRKSPPGDPEVQRVIARHYGITREFWGLSGGDTPRAEAYAGLGELYVQDERFVRNMIPGGEDLEGFALFLKEAMGLYARSGL